MLSAEAEKAEADNTNRGLNNSSYYMALKDPAF